MGKFRCAFLSCACLFLSTAFAADVAGIWTGQVTGRNGEPQDITFQFAQQGERLTGKMYGDSEDVPLTEGTVERDKISFTVVLTFGANKTVFHYSGTIEGRQMRLTRERERDPGEEKPKDTRQNFTLSRMT